MKKFLSLVLALVMAMSLVTVSAGAKDFNDGDKISGIAYEEAVNVMSEMGIIDGYGDGNFQPQGTLTRGAAAKIIACMMLGKTTAEALGTQAAPFKDVPVGSTFAGYIAYCSESGIIDGYSDGTFRPGNSLTGFAFLKMLLTALGYDSDIEGYANNPNWTVNVAGRAKQVGLLDGNEAFVGTRAATREEACLYAVNALQATLVEYKDKGGNITVGDISINTSASNATYVISNVYDQATSIDDTTDNGTQWTVEFAEKYQPDLRLKGATDAFGRPAHTWTWKNNEVGTYVNYDELVAEYTTKITGKDLYDLLGKTALEDCDGSIYVYVDGETERDVLGDAYFTSNQMAKTYDEKVGETGNGVLTQVFHNTRDDEITVAVINTYLAKAAEDYDEKNDELDLTVFAIDDVKRNQYVKDGDVDTDMTVSGEDFDIAEVAEGDLFLVTVAEGEIQTMAAPEIMAGSTVTSFRVDKYVVTGGTQYDFASTARYDVETLYDWTGISAESNLKNLTYDIILDPYGYAIGVKLVEDPSQYLFLTGIDEKNSNLGSRNAEANVIFTDGKMDTVTVNLRNSRGLDNNGRPDDNGTLLDAYNSYSQLNTWCTYTVDANGVYTLRQVPTTDNDGAATPKTYKAMQAAQDADDAANDEVEINKSHVALDGVGGGVAGNAYSRVYGNDETIYINVDNVADLLATPDVNGHDTVIIDDVDSVNVGVRNVDLLVEDLDGMAAWAGEPVPANEIYTLHDKDGYIIAVVTIGEDQGTTTNYAYITGDVEQETYGSDKDEWSWIAPAIVNGKAVELREVGDGLTLLRNLNEGEWYEVRYDADGNVRKITRLTNDFVSVYNPVDNDKYLDDIDAVQVAINDGTDNLVLWQDFCDLDGDVDATADLSFKGNTLFVDTLGAATRGFSVSPDVNVVLCLADKSHSPLDDIDDSYTGSAGLQKALRNLDTEPTDSNGDGIEEYTLNGYLSFIMEDGVITSIVLNDYTGPRDNTVNAAAPVLTAGAANSTVNATIGDEVTLSVTVGAAANDRHYGTLSYQWYKENGANDIAVGTNSPSLTVTAANGDQYYCVVTNYDNGRDITGEVRTSTTSGVFTISAEGPTMDVMVTFKLAGGTQVGQSKIITGVALEANGKYALLMENAANKALVDAVVPANYEAVSADPVIYTDSIATATVTVAHKTVEVSVPTGLQISWDAVDGLAAGTDEIGTVDVPQGVEVTVEPVAGSGTYTAAGETAEASWTITSGEDGLEFPEATEYGYYKVDFTVGGTFNGYVTVDDDQDHFVKASDADSMTFVINITHNTGFGQDRSGDVITNSVTAGTATVETAADSCLMGEQNGTVTVTIRAITTDATVSLNDWQ